MIYLKIYIYIWIQLVTETTILWILSMYKFIQLWMWLFIFRKALTIICNHLHYHIYSCRSSVYYNSIILRSAYMDWWNWLCIVYQLLSTIYIYWYCLLLSGYIDYWSLTMDLIYICLYWLFIYTCIYIYHYLSLLIIDYGSGSIYYWLDMDLDIYICSYYILLVHTT